MEDAAMEIGRRIVQAARLAVWVHLEQERVGRTAAVPAAKAGETPAVHSERMQWWDTSHPTEGGGG